MKGHGKSLMSWQHRSRDAFESYLSNIDRMPGHIPLLGMVAAVAHHLYDQLSLKFAFVVLGWLSYDCPS